ncbi:MAG: glucose-1-phosphate thymidylyltransferase [Candidatus Methylomirabilales bacterium]
MKALVLSGGRGTRLRPITYTSAKQLVPIANKAILSYVLEMVAAAGIREVGMVVGETQQEIRSAVGTGEEWGLDVTYIEQEAPLGLAHAVKIARPYLGSRPFVMVLGDNILRDGIASLVKEYQRVRPNTQILLSKVKDPQRFGVAGLQGDRVVSLEEKPKIPKSDYALVGVYLFDQTIFEAVEAIRPSWRKELEITDAIQYQIDRGYAVVPHIVSGWWKDTGRLEDLLEANRLILSTLEARVEGRVDADSVVEGKVVIEAGAELVRSTIRGPVIIGRHARIVNARIGPFTSIAAESEVVNSEVADSVIMEQARIVDLEGRMEESLIGRNVHVCRCASSPGTLRLMLGDNSQVGIA